MVKAWRGDAARLGKRLSGLGVVVPAALLILLIGCQSKGPAPSAAAPPSSQPAAAAGQPGFSSAQVSAGIASYGANCAGCHGANLEGKSGPLLSGTAFLARWANGHHPLSDLYAQIATRMPLNAPGSLQPDEDRTILAFILSRNGFAPGTTDLTEADLDVMLQAPAGTSKPIATEVPQAPKSVEAATTTRPNDDDILNPQPGDWLLYNRTLRGDRYSPLRQVTTGNAKRLQAVCAFQTGETGPFQTAPVIYDGLMYVTTAYNTFALDARTCRKVWQYTFESTASTLVSLNRGAAIYRGKVIRVTPDGHLLALDAKSGKLLWDALVADASRGYWLAAAPGVYDGKVFMAEAGSTMQNGNSHIFAFDSETGKPLWQFDVIPTGDQPGADTWKAGSETGGGPIWTTFTIDPTRNLVLASVGNPGPDYDGTVRPGDNLYTDSVVALDIATGKLSWYAQQVPHDVHDWDTAAAPVLYRTGNRDYVAVASKDGFMYIYDAVTHRLVTRVQTSRQENAELPLGPQLVHVCPGIVGGTEWNGPAYSPKLGLLYVNAVDACGKFGSGKNVFTINGRSVPQSGTFIPDPPSAASGSTRAFEGATGKPIWANITRTPMTAGLTPTAGDVLFTGDLDGNFLALDAETGKTLYSFNTGGAIGGAPATYLVDGKQYIAISSGNASKTIWMTTGAATIFVFALPEN